MKAQDDNRKRNNKNSWFSKHDNIWGIDFPWSFLGIWLKLTKFYPNLLLTGISVHLVDYFLKTFGFRDGVQENTEFFSESILGLIKDWNFDKLKLNER